MILIHPKRHYINSISKFKQSNITEFYTKEIKEFESYLNNMQE